MYLDLFRAKEAAALAKAQAAVLGAVLHRAVQPEVQHIVPSILRAEALEIVLSAAQDKVQLAVRDSAEEAAQAEIRTDNRAVVRHVSQAAAQAADLAATQDADLAADQAVSSVSGSDIDCGLPSD